MGLVTLLAFELQEAGIAEADRDDTVAFAAEQPIPADVAVPTETDHRDQTIRRPDLTNFR